MLLETNKNYQNFGNIKVSVKIGISLSRSESDRTIGNPQGIGSKSLVVKIYTGGPKG